MQRGKQRSPALGSGLWFPGVCLETGLHRGSGTERGERPLAGRHVSRRLLSDLGRMSTVGFTDGRPHLGREHLQESAGLKLWREFHLA